MITSCEAFLERLERVLSGRALSPELAGLAWHAHLASCEDCRELLAAEEALEALLDSLPEPHLPPALARRVLAALESARHQEQALDHLLELPAAEPAPPGLAASVLASLSAQRGAARPGARAGAGEGDASLDRLLDRLPAPAPPSGLAERVLAGVEGSRSRARTPTTPAAMPARAADIRPPSRPLWRLLPVAAALIALAGATWWTLSAPGTSPDGEPVAANPGRPAAPEPSEELLASLELLESWELLTDDDLDLMLSALEPIDQVLLELAAPAEGEPGGDSTSTGNPPSNG